MFRSFAPAKVNLFLHVTGRRADGYHLLDSLAVFPAVGDWVSVAPAGGLSLEVSGPFGEVLRGEADNLLLRAARVLKPGAGAALGLEKNLPVASGIGGGSADAAAALRLLARVWGAERGLEDAALALGADVPVCLARRVARMGGIGEVLTPGPALPAFGMVLVNPGVAVATPAVFRARTGDFSASVEMPPGWDDAGAMAAWLAAQRNDLEGAAIGLEPVIAEVLAALAGALLARMSGSGATCFGIYETPARAAEAATALARPGWWCWGGGLYEPGPQDL